MNKALPPVVFGFIVLLLLPGVIAAVDVAQGMAVPYPVLLDLWTKPWIFVSWFVLFGFLVDVRRSGQPWLWLPRFDVIAILALVALGLALRQALVANRTLADIQLLRVLLALALGVAAFYGMRVYQARFSRPIYLALFIGVVALAPALVVFLYIQTPVLAPPSGFSWQVPGFGAVRLFGMALEAGIAVGIGLLVVGRKSRFTLLVWVGVVALWAMLFWSGGRGAGVSLFGAAVVLSLLRPRYILRLWAVFLVSALLGAGFSFLIWTPDDGAFGIMNMAAKSARPGLDAISSSRLVRWQGAVALIADRPWFGHGLGQFSNLWPDFAAYDLRRESSAPLPIYFLAYRTVHNLVLEVFLAWGFVGGTVFFWVLGRGWLGALERVRMPGAEARIPAFLGLNALLLHSMLAGTYAVPHTLFYIALFFGICLAPKPA